MPTASGPAGATRKKRLNQQQKKKAGTAPLKKKPGFLDDITGFLEDLDVELDSRSRLIEFEAQRRQDEVRNIYSREIMKLPKSIRTMSVKEFIEKHGGEISSVLEHDKQQVLKATGLSTSSPSGVMLRSAQAISRSMSMRKSRGGTLKRVNNVPSSDAQLRTRATIRAALEASATKRTPGATPSRGAVQSNGFATPRIDANVAASSTPATLLASSKAARPLRRGESLMSINGSPIVGSGVDGLQSALALAEKLRDEELSETEKETTVSQLAVLQNELNSIMQRINKPK